MYNLKTLLVITIILRFSQSCRQKKRETSRNPELSQYQKDSIRLDKQKISSNYTVNEALLNPYKTTHLELINMVLTSLPDSIFTLNNLTSLSLDRNENIDLNGIQRLKNLKVLFIQYCNLDTFPKIICELSKLESLYLSNNKFTFLPNENVLIHLPKRPFNE